MSKLTKTARGKPCKIRNDECWKPIHDFQGIYDVSSFGRVRVLERRIQMRWPGRFRLQKERILRSNSVHDYARVALTKDGKETTHLVHRLVANAFVIGSGSVVRHLDGNYRNNIARNLAWGSYVDNEEDKRRHGRLMQGETHHRNKYPLAVIKKIMKLRSNGKTHKEISIDLDVNLSTVRKVLYKIQWVSALTEGVMRTQYELIRQGVLK